MKKYDIEFLPAADKDLDDIFDYILLDNTSEDIMMLEKIEEFPLLGKQLIHKSLNYYNFRMIIVESYIVFYVQLLNTRVFRHEVKAICLEICSTIGI